MFFRLKDVIINLDRVLYIQKQGCYGISFILDDKKTTTSVHYVKNERQEMVFAENNFVKVEFESGDIRDKEFTYLFNSLNKEKI